MAAVIYIRVSTDEQAESGLGLEAQEHACRAWAAREGVAVASVHRADGEKSGTPPAKRPVLCAALAALTPGDTLLVARRDRLVRSVEHSLAIGKVIAAREATITSAAGEASEDDGPQGWLIRLILDAFNEYTRLMISVMTAAALQAKKRRGEWTGGRLPPWAVVVEGRVEYPAEVRCIVHGTRSGTTRECAAALALAGFRSARGFPVHPSSVQALRRAMGGKSEEI